MIVVDGEDEKFTFSMDDVESTFIPRRYDQISFVCKVQRDPKLLNEAGVTVEVVKIEPNIKKRITGKITHIEPDLHGIIEEKYFFTWDALVTDYRMATVGDKVTAECIQCERCDETVWEWRCLKVVLIENATSHVVDDQRLVLPKLNETANKNGIEMTDYLKVDFNDINLTKEFTMTVKNTADEVQKVLESVFIGNKYDSQLKLLSPDRNTSFFLQPGEEKQYKFEARSKHFGDAQEKFYIKFSGPTGRFKIIRNITVSVHDVEQVHPFMGTGSNLHKNLSYTRRVFSKDTSRAIPGVPLKRSANFVKTKFQHWDVPKRFMEVVLDPKSTPSFISEMLDSVMPFLNEDLNIKIYSRVFHHLLYLEECEMVISCSFSVSKNMNFFNEIFQQYHNMRKYDKKAFFKREGEYLSLAVQNIAESRPSLVIGES